MKPIRGGLLSGLVAAILLLALPPATSWATYPGANGRIAYLGSFGGPQGDIYTVLADGTSVRRLTSSDLAKFDPAWSANGRRLAFAGYRPPRRGEGTQIWTMRADGSDKTQVTHRHRELYLFEPYFSPDQGRIVYTEQPFGSQRTRRIFTIRPDGSHRRQIVKGHYLTDPAYSPSGGHIVFGGAPRGRSAAFWTVHPDGSDLKRLTPPERPPISCDGVPTDFCGGNSNIDLDYSPDGSHIAFSRCDYGWNPTAPNCDIYLMRANGSYQHSIWHAEQTYVYGLTYSPAGDRIAFSFWPVAYGPDAVGTTIYTMTPTGADLQPVTESEHGVWSARPSWQPVPSG